MHHDFSAPRLLGSARRAPRAARQKSSIVDRRQNKYMSRGRVHIRVADVLDRIVYDPSLRRREDIDEGRPTQRPRPLGLWALSEFGAIDRTATDVYRRHGPTNQPPTGRLFSKAPTDAEWRAQLAGQTRLTVSAQEALDVVRKPGGPPSKRQMTSAKRGPLRYKRRMNDDSQDMILK